MIRWLVNLWNDFFVAVDELGKAGFTLPMTGYPFDWYINPEWFEEKKPFDSDDASEQQ